MKRLFAVAGPIAMMVFLSQPALAGRSSTPPATSTGQSAVVFKGTFCLVPEVGNVTTQSHADITPSGNVTLTCHAQTSRRAHTTSEHLDEICTTPGGIATSGHLVITRSGRVNLVCHIHTAQTAAVAVSHGKGIVHRWSHGAVAGGGPSQVGKKLGHSEQ